MTFYRAPEGTIIAVSGFTRRELSPAEWQVLALGFPTPAPGYIQLSAAQTATLRAMTRTA